MKKIFALLLMVVMSVTLLAGCGSDPVYDDLENFLNVEMKEVNADYTKITEEVGKWEAYEDDAQILASINDTLLHKEQCRHEEQAVAVAELPLAVAEVSPAADAAAVQDDKQ